MPQNSECESNNLIFCEKYLSGSWQSTAMDMLWFRLFFLGVALGVLGGLLVLLFSFWILVVHLFYYPPSEKKKSVH